MRTPESHTHAHLSARTSPPALPVPGWQLLDYSKVALDIGRCMRSIAGHNGRGYRHLVHHRVSSILLCFQLTMINGTRRTVPLSFTTSDGHTLHPCSAVSRNAALPRQHHARRSSAHTDAHASSINCFPTASLGPWHSRSHFSRWAPTHHPSEC